MEVIYIFLVCVGIILFGILSLWIPLLGLIGLVFGVVIILPEIISTVDTTFRSIMIVSFFATALLFAIGYKRR